MTSEPDTVPTAAGEPMAARAGARRRRPEELRRLLLDAGARLFAEQGYEATTYRQITTLAGVSDSVLFRNFGSRDQLLIEAVVAPFAEFLDDFSRRWSELATVGANGEHPLRRAFVTELFSRLREHREPLRAMLTVLQSPAGEQLMREVGSRLDAVIDRLRAIGEQHDRARGRPTDGVELKTRLVVGMVVTAAVLDDWFIPADSQKVASRLLTEAMAELALVGCPVIVLVLPDPEVDDADTVGRRGASAQPGRRGVSAQPGRRRRPDAVRGSIVLAARELFADPGYGATTYRTIAEAAGTSESALFRHFGTKSALVHESVFEPVVEAFAAHRERWTAFQLGPVQLDTVQLDTVQLDTVRLDGAGGGRASSLLVEMYRFFRTQRAQLRLLMGLAHEGVYATLNDQVRTWFGEAVRGVVPDTTDPQRRARISSLVAMALAAATLDDWFLPHGAAASSTPDIETALDRIAAEGPHGAGGRSGG